MLVNVQLPKLLQNYSYVQVVKCPTVRECSATPIMVSSGTSPKTIKRYTKVAKPMILPLEVVS